MCLQLSLCPWSNGSSHWNALFIDGDWFRFPWCLSYFLSPLGLRQHCQWPYLGWCWMVKQEGGCGTPDNQPAFASTFQHLSSSQKSLPFENAQKNGRSMNSNRWTRTHESTWKTWSFFIILLQKLSRRPWYPICRRYLYKGQICKAPGGKNDTTIPSGDFSIICLL